MQDQIRQEKIVGSRRFSNYFWALFLFLGGLGFLLAGYSSPSNLKNPVSFGMKRLETEFFQKTRFLNADFWEKLGF